MVQPVYGSSYVPPSLQGTGNAHKFTGTSREHEIDWQPNLLDYYDLPTYHFKFFMVGPEAQANGTYLDPQNQVIIAESGISDYTIDDVSVTTVCQPSYECGTGTATEFKFKITEPSGAAFLDKLYYTSLDIGIGNWAKSPYYLELSFRARDPDTSAPAGLGIEPGSGNWVDGELSQLRWVWPIVVTGIKANITHVGTIYDFEAKIYGEFAFGNASSVIQHNVVLDNVTTVAEAISLLQIKLNSDSTDKLIDGYLVPDVYEFEVDPELARLPIIPQNNNKNSNRQGGYYNLNTKTFTFPSGTGIEQMVNVILATTGYFQEKIKASGGSSGVDTENSYPDSVLQEIWRIIPHSVPYKYDTGRQSNAHYIKFYIIKFAKGNLPTTASKVDDNTHGKTKYAEYKRLGILRKKYEYIFTGQNDQIYEFDITINNGFAIANSRFGGLYYNSSHSDPGIVHQSDINKKDEALKAVSKYVGMFNDSTKSSSDIEKARVEYEEKIAAARVPIDSGSQPGLTDAELDSIQLYLDHAKNPDRALHEAQSVTAKNTSMAASSPSRSYAAPTRFVGDQERLSQEAITNRANKLAKSGELKTPGPFVRPISSVSSPTEKALSDGVEDKSNWERNSTSAIFSQAMTQNADGSFANIRLKIKGDPFWLSRNPVTTSSLIEPAPTIEGLYKKLDSTANANTTTNFMLVRLRTPKLFSVIDDNTSSPFTEVDTLSAVYSINNVTHSFVNGLFSQVLDGTIDPPIDVNKFLNEIETSEREASNAALIAADLPINPIPALAGTTSNTVGVLRGTPPSRALGNTLTQTLSETVNNPLGLPPTSKTLPGLDLDKIHSIGKESTLKSPGIPGISAPVGSELSVNLARILETSLSRSRRGK